MNKLIVIFFMFFLSTYLYASDTYLLNVDSKDVNDSSFGKNFKTFLEQNLENSGRLKLGGYYQNLVDADDIKLAEYEININFIRVTEDYRSIIKVINLKTGAIEFSFSISFSYNEIMQPAYCAQILSSKFLEKIRVIALVIDRKDSDYILDAGANFGITKGDKFNVYENSGSQNVSSLIAQLEVVVVQQKKSIAKIVSQRENINYGAICVLQTNGISERQKNCSDVFVPAILQNDLDCSLFVESIPTGCDIYLNDCKYEFKSPTHIKRLKPGVIQLFLYKRGYKRYSEPIELIPGAFLEKKYILEKEETFGALEIESEPEGAQVLINGIHVGATPFSKVDIDAGNLEITIQLKGFKSQTKYINLHENEKKICSVTLERMDLEKANQICAGKAVKKLLLYTVRALKEKNNKRALKELKKAYELDKRCAMVFYIKGLIEWIEFNEKSMAENAFSKAFQLGFRFNKNMPHPELLDTEGKLKVLHFLELKFQSGSL